MDMEVVIYLVVLAGWIVYSFLKKRKKAEESRARTAAPVAGEQSLSQAQPGGRTAEPPAREKYTGKPEGSMEDIFDAETLLGELLMGKRAFAEEPVPVLDTLESAEGESLETYEKKTHNFSSYETLETSREETKATYSPVPVAAPKEALHPIAEMTETGEMHADELLPEESVDMRKAVIYSAILNRPEY